MLIQHPAIIYLCKPCSSQEHSPGPYRDSHIHTQVLLKTRGALSCGTTASSWQGLPTSHRHPISYFKASSLVPAPHVHHTLLNSSGPSNSTCCLAAARHTLAQTVHPHWPTRLFPRGGCHHIRPTCTDTQNLGVCSHKTASRLRTYTLCGAPHAQQSCMYCPNTP